MDAGRIQELVTADRGLAAIALHIALCKWPALLGVNSVHGQ